MLWLQVDGRHIRVDRAGQSAHGSAGGSNLPFDVEVSHAGFTSPGYMHLHDFMISIVYMAYPNGCRHEYTSLPCEGIGSYDLYC